MRVCGPCLWRGLTLLLALLAALGACAPQAKPVPTRMTVSASPTAGATRPRLSQVRKAAFAGQFYPADPKELQQLVDSYLAQATRVGGRPIALIAPHAGYVYSGQVAGYAFKQAEGQLYDVIVVLGTNHTSDFRDIAVYPEGAFETPLGLVAVDAEVAGELVAAHEKIVAATEPHRYEHSIEVELPFLQRVAPDTPIVPVVIGAPTEENCRILSEALVQVLAGRRALVVASSDMSHYPTYEDAVRVDGRMLAAIETFDVEAVQHENLACLGEKVPNLVCTLCGLGPVLTAMMYARKAGANEATVLGYMNSGDTPQGDRSRVVGYGAVMFWRWEPMSLSIEERRQLLRLARETIRANLEKRPLPTLENPSPQLQQLSGVFVTLRKAGKLRGCIGYILPHEPLYAAVQSAAISAATRDPRFEPVSARELAEIEIEISVLSPLHRVRDVSEIEVGKHGLYIVKGRNAGLLLPQVATEQGWDREAFLAGVCQKAGLPANAWREGATLYAFTAEVFGEIKPGDPG